MPDPTQDEVQPHHPAEELLPWYATGRLDREDRALVENHLSSCAQCREQLTFERRMVDEFVALSPEVEAGWARLKARIAQPRSAPSGNGWWGRIVRESAELWGLLTRPAVAALATVQLVLIGVAGILVSMSQQSYRALGSAPPPQSANAIVMFRADTTESRLRALMQSNGASLVGGPTSADAYLLRVPAQSRQAVLARLRADRHVTLAQPIDGAPS